MRHKSHVWQIMWSTFDNVLKTTGEKGVAGSRND